MAQIEFGIVLIYYEPPRRGQPPNSLYLTIARTEQVSCYHSFFCFQVVDRPKATSYYTWVIYSRASGIMRSVIDEMADLKVPFTRPFFYKWTLLGFLFQATTVSQVHVLNCTYMHNNIVTVEHAVRLSNYCSTMTLPLWNQLMDFSPQKFMVNSLLQVV